MGQAVQKKVRLGLHLCLEKYRLGLSTDNFFTVWERGKYANLPFKAGIVLRMIRIVAVCCWTVMTTNKTFREVAAVFGTHTTTKYELIDLVNASDPANTIYLSDLVEATTAGDMNFDPFLGDEDHRPSTQILTGAHVDASICYKLWGSSRY